MITSEPRPGESPIDALLSQPAKQEMVRGFFQAVDAAYGRLASSGYAKNTVDGVQRKGFPAFITENGALVELYGYEKNRPTPEAPIADASEADMLVTAARSMMENDVRVRGHLVDLRTDTLELIPLEPFFPSAANQLDARAQERTIFMPGMNYAMFFGHSEQARIQTAAKAIGEVNARVVMRQAGVDEESATRAALDDLAKEGVYLLSINTRRTDDDREAQEKLGMIWTNRTESEYFATARERNGISF